MLFRLVRTYIARHRFLGGLIVLGLMITLVFAFFLLSMYANVYQVVVQKTLGETDTLQSFSLVESPDKNKLQSGNILDDVLLENIRDYDDIDDLYAFYTVHVPASVIIDAFGLQIESDMQLYAVNDEYFYDTVGSLEGVGASQQLLDVYNVSLGGTSPLYPTLTPEILSVADLHFSIGESSFFRYDTVFETTEKLVIIDATMPLLGVTFPLSRVQDIVDSLPAGSVSLYKITGSFSTQESFDSFIQSHKDRYSLTYPDQRLDKIEDDLQGLKLLLGIMFGFMFILVVVFTLYIVRSLLQRHERMFAIFQSLGAHYTKGLQFLLYEISVYGMIARCLAVILFWSIERLIHDYSFWGVEYVSLGLQYYIRCGLFSLLLLYILSSMLYVLVEKK